MEGVRMTNMGKTMTRTIIARTKRSHHQNFLQ